MDYVLLPDNGDGGYASIGIEEFNEVEASLQDEALRSVFRMNRIPINAAGPDLLQTISGIGPKLAERIITEREQGGDFHSADDLMRVSGIGTKRITIFKKYLSFD